MRLFRPKARPRDQQIHSSGARRRVNRERFGAIYRVKCPSEKRSSDVWRISVLQTRLFVSESRAILECWCPVEPLGFPLAAHLQNPSQLAQIQNSRETLAREHPVALEHAVSCDPQAPRNQNIAADIHERSVPAGVAATVGTQTNRMRRQQ